VYLVTCVGVVGVGVGVGVGEIGVWARYSLRGAAAARSLRPQPICAGLGEDRGEQTTCVQIYSN
jgi:hypothetical protein